MHDSKLYQSEVTETQVTITDKQYEALKHLHLKAYRWLARDKDGKMFAYIVEPDKGKSIWSSHYQSGAVISGAVIIKDTFDFVTWEDEKAVNIQQLMQSYESQKIKPKIKIETILNKKKDLYYKKNADYGNSFEELMDEYGLIALIIRLTDKLNRIKSLQKNEQQVMDESIKDTLMDLSNYADMGLLWMENQEVAE